MWGGLDCAVLHGVGNGSFCYYDFVIYAQCILDDKEDRI